MHELKSRKSRYLPLRSNACRVVCFASGRLLLASAVSAAEGAVDAAGSQLQQQAAGGSSTAQRQHSAGREWSVG